MIYFPGVFSSLALLIIVGFSKFFFRSTSFPTSLTSLLSVPQFVIYCYFLYLVTTEGGIVQLALACTSLSILIVISISFIIVTVRKVHLRD
jgi:heme/copper-type cytochrome/quinol oxidase subunit 4